MIRRLLAWRRESWNRHRCHQLAAHARYSAAAALEHLCEMEEDLQELRRRCPKTGNGIAALAKLTEEEIAIALQPLDDLSCRGSGRPVDRGLAAYEREIERRR